MAREVIDVEKLKNVWLFQDLTDSELLKLAELGVIKEFKGGEYVIREGEEAKALYVILSGMIKVIKELPDGTRRELSSMTEGDFFGELGLLDGEPRPASVMAVTPLQVVAFYRKDFLNFMQKHPMIAAKILFRIAQVIGKRLRKANEQIRDILVWQALKEKLN